MNAAAQVDDPGSVFSHYRRLISLRHTEPAVAHGDFTMLLPDDDAVYAFTRRYSDGRGEVELLVLGNFTGEKVDAEIDGWAGAELVLGNYPDAAGRYPDGWARRTTRGRAAAVGGTRAPADPRERPSDERGGAAQAIAAGVSSGTLSCNVPSASTAVGRRPARRSSRVIRTSSAGTVPISSRIPSSSAVSATRRTSAVPRPRCCQVSSTSTPKVAVGGRHGVGQAQVRQADRAAAVAGQREDRTPADRVDERAQLLRVQARGGAEEPRAPGRRRAARVQRVHERHVRRPRLAEQHLGAVVQQQHRVERRLRRGRP